MNETSLKLVEKVIGVRFKKPQLLQQIFGNGGLQKERRYLAYLGDAITEFTVREYFLKHRKDVENIFFWCSGLVTNKVLTCVVERMGLKKLLDGERELETAGEKCFGTIFEALVGAIYLDRGVRQARAFVQRFLLANFEDVLGEANQENAIQRLHEVFQRRFRRSPEFVQVTSFGNAGRISICKIYLPRRGHRGGTHRDRELIAQGHGSEMKSAKIDASLKALEVLCEIE